MPLFPNFRRSLVSLLLLWLWIASSAGPSAVRADDRTLPADALLRIHVDPLRKAADVAIVSQIWERLASSRAVTEAMQTVEAVQLRDRISQIENRLGQSWSQIVSRLTAGGVDLAVCVRGEPQLLLMTAADDESTSRESFELLVALIAEADHRSPDDIPTEDHRGVTTVRLGPVVAAVVGARLLLASHGDLLRESIDQLLEESSPRLVEEAEASFAATAHVDLVRLRSLPGVSEALSFPARDAGVVTFLGGWVDLLRRSESSVLELRCGSESLDAVVRFSGASSAAPAGLAGFWADMPDESPAPLLNVPRLIYSTSWYRDYGALWGARDQLVTAQAVKELERADREAAAQFEALGSAVSLSDIVDQFGPRFRIVVAEQAEPPYDIPLRNLLPAAAFVVELEDETAFRELAAPLIRVVHLILSFEQKIVAETIDHAGITLHRLSLPYTDRDLTRRDRSGYNFRPTHGIAHGHLIVGSTPEIAAHVVDALAVAQSEDRPPVSAGRTSQQMVDVRRAAAALDGVREAVVRQAVLSSGQDVATANRELDILRSLLGLFSRAVVTETFTDDGFELRVRSTVANDAGNRN